MEAEKSSANAQLEVLQQNTKGSGRTKSGLYKQKSSSIKWYVLSFCADSAIHPDTAKALKRALTQLHKEHVELRLESVRNFQKMDEIMKQAKAGSAKLALANQGSSEEVEELRDLYRRECLQRKLLYNKLQEMRGNIRVFCRCRYDENSICCLNFGRDNDITTPNNSTKPYNFDKVFDTKSTQEEVNFQFFQQLNSPFAQF